LIRPDASGRPGLSSQARELREWLTRRSLPLWAGAGFDPEHGRFEERLALDGVRVPGIPIRLMTQARQIYVYSLATGRQWHDAAYELVERAYASMLRDFHRRDGRDGWIHSIWRDGTIADARRDLYAHAFVLLAIASYVQATGKREALGLADETLAFIDRFMRAGQAGGYVDAVPANDGLRRQNPHMHLFEALLALWSCSGEARYLARAGEMFGLFTSHFFRADSGVLTEYFNAALEPADGVAGKIAEPGHHHEWIWLLRRFERASGRVVGPYVDMLFAHADAHGYDDAGLIVDEVLSDGSPWTRSRRIWPVTEAIKGNLTEAALGRPGSESKAAMLAIKLQEYFLKSELAGGWIDRLDETGAPSTDFMPANTLYHVACAIEELDRFVHSTAV
jgi:mannose/cellobiose epimerase-like protein (N-acyl-D-glucosamine 2-epimerase family)